MHHEPLATLIGAIMHGKNTYNQKIRVDEIVRVKILRSVHIDIWELTCQNSSST